MEGTTLAMIGYGKGESFLTFLVLKLAMVFLKSMIPQALVYYLGVPYCPHNVPDPRLLCLP